MDLLDDLDLHGNQILNANLQGTAQEVSNPLDIRISTVTGVQLYTYTGSSPVLVDISSKSLGAIDTVKLSDGTDIPVVDGILTLPYNISNVSRLALDNRIIIDYRNQLESIDRSKLTNESIIYCLEDNSYYKYDGDKFSLSDQLIDSDDIPKMDGIAQSGFRIGEYSLIDHIHPTDTTRASVQYVNKLHDELRSNMSSGLIDIKLKHPLKFGSITYDGSSEVTIHLSDLLSWEIIEKLFKDHGIILKPNLNESN